MKKEKMIAEFGPVELTTVFAVCFVSPERTYRLELQIKESLHRSLESWQMWFQEKCYHPVVKLCHCTTKCGWVCGSQSNLYALTPLIGQREQPGLRSRFWLVAWKLNNQHVSMSVSFKLAVWWFSDSDNQQVSVWMLITLLALITNGTAWIGALYLRMSYL